MPDTPDISFHRFLIERMQALSGPLEPVPTGEAPRLPSPAPVEAVCFDIYGTLLISGSGDVGTATAMDSVDAMGAALLETGLASPGAAAGPALESYQAAIRRGHQVRKEAGVEHPEIDIRTVWQDVLADLVRAGLTDRPVLETDPLRAAVEYECRVNPVWPMPGAREVLTHLGRAGMPLGIVSNAQFYTPLLLEALFGHTVRELGFRPDLCAWSYRLLEAKPSVNLFQAPLAALAAEDLRPDQVLYVGNDMLNDVRAAGEGGCRTMLFAGDRRSLRWRTDDPRCAGIQPGGVLSHLEQLIPWLEPYTGPLFADT